MAATSDERIGECGVRTYQDSDPCLESAIHYTTVQTTNAYHYHRNSISTSRFASPSYPDMASTLPLFSKKELEDMILDRKRYLTMGYITGGVPVSNDTRTEDDQKGGATETVVTEVEETTSVATVTTQHCCPAHGQGCVVDHGATLYGTTYTRRSGKLVQLPMIEDTGSGSNWLPRELARELQCELLDAEPNTFPVDFGGNEYIVKKKVKVSLSGIKSRVEEVEFLIPPDRFPLRCAVLGRDFIQKSGHPYQWFANTPSTVGIIVQAQITATEQHSMLILKAEADRKAEELAQKHQKSSRRRNRTKRASTTDSGFGSREKEA